MTTVTCDMAVSVDGFAAGPNQSLAEPFGEGIEGRLTRWMVEQPEANAAAIEGIGAASAYVMGRNMFSPGRGDWDEQWTGWWGDESALAQAREAAGDGDVAIAGGAQTVNEYLAAGLIDELRLHVAPVVIGAGERLFDGVAQVDLERLEVIATDLVTHMTYRVASP
jgi:RibD C-terminal domain